MHTHPLAIIGAGPIGLAAAAHAHARGLPVVVLEAGDGAGHAVRQWGHVRLFSPWGELIDPVAAALLADSGWQAPDPDGYPTGAEWVAAYLEPLAKVLDDSDLAQIRYDARVSGVARRGRDLMVNDRAAESFVLHVDAGNDVLAHAVIDASGTWGSPNPLGADGYPAAGELAHADRITYGMPDLSDPATGARFAGRHVAVAGTGASAHNVLVALGAVADAANDTRVSWLVRRADAGFGGGDHDELVERGALGKRAQQVASSGLVTRHSTFRTTAVDAQPDGRLRLTSIDGQQLDDVDEVVVVTGFRPDLALTSEIRIDLDPALQAPRRLAPLIDPNVHSCGSVAPHGAAELSQPEPGFYLAGMKSYGRAPSFLTLTGFEQVRSIVAEIAGDHVAAARVELTLPESGVCGGSGAFDDGASNCCGPTQPELLTIGPGTVER